MLAIPGFFAEQSLRAFQLRYYLGNAPAPGPHSRLRPMLSEPWVDYYLSEVFGGGTGGTDAGVAAGPDGGTPDAGTPDAGTPDAGTPDAGTPDAGAPDAGPPDAGSEDTYLPQPVRVRCYELRYGQVVEVPCNYPKNQI